MIIRSRNTVLCATFALGITMQIQSETKQEPKKTVDQVVKDTMVEMKDIRIRWTNFGEALQQADLAKELSKELEKTAKSLQEKNQKLQEKLAKDMKNYEAQQKTLSPEARGKKEGELLALRRECEVLAQTSKEEIDRAMQQETEKLWKEFEQSVKQLAEKDGLDMVVDIYTGRMVYASGKIGINDSVIKNMNKNYEIAKTKSKADVKVATSAKAVDKA